MKSRILITATLILVFFEIFHASIIANEKIKLKADIKDIKISGILIKVKYLIDLSERKESHSWYVNTKLGVLVLITNKDSEEERLIDQYEGKEVIIKGLGEVVNEKNEKGEKITTTNLKKFVSIELKKGLRIGDRKGCKGKGG